MHEIVEEGYQQFIFDFEVEGSVVFARYVDESEYENEYSHDAIKEAQKLFISKIKTYLHENFPSRYAILAGSYCVFVMTIEEAESRHLRDAERLIMA